jgi:hypothetical protein
MNDTLIHGWFESATSSNVPWLPLINGKSTIMAVRDHHFQRVPWKEGGEHIIMAP